MENRNLGFILWACAGVLLLLLGLSMAANGTWMGGLGMGWMMAVPLLVLGLAIFFAYRYGRMSERVDQLEHPKK